MTSQTITVDLDAETAALVARVAAARGMTVEQFAAAAIRAAAEEHAAFLAFVEEGERDFAEGRHHTEEEMREFFREGIAEARAEMARRHAAE